MFSKVVVGLVNGDLDSQVARDVIALAKTLASPDGKLTLLRVHLVKAKPIPDSGAVAHGAECSEAEQRLTAFAGQLSVGAEVQCVEARSARHGLHQFVTRQRADLLVVGQSLGARAARSFRGDNARAVLEDAPCAVAVAPTGFAAGAGAIKKVGVGFDGSAESERAVALARKLAAELRAELSAFEAVPVSVYARDPWNLKGEVEQHLEAARHRVAALGHLQPSAGFGDPAHELAEYAKSVDLLVLGSHDYRPIEHLLERTTAQRLAGEASSSLLVIAAS